MVEAADTTPFFHNNVAVTLEDAIDFYPRTPSTTRALTGRAIRLRLSRSANQIVKFLHGLNTLQNIDVARRELQEILNNNNNPQREQDTRLQTAFDETQDGIDVLTQAGIWTTAKNFLIEARNLISQAQVTPPRNV